MRLIFLWLCAILAFAHSKKDKKDWGYKDTGKVYVYSTHSEMDVLGPKDWSKQFKKCAGKTQSPINIVSKKAKKTKFGPLKIKFKSSNFGYFSGDMVNDGKAPAFTLYKKKGNTITIKFDKKKYILEKFLFHFGCRDPSSTRVKGSEHTLDGKAFDAELQFIFYNKKFKTLKKAEKKKNGVLNLSVFVQKSKNPYYYYGKTEGLDALLTPLLTVLASGYVRVGIPIVKTELPLQSLVKALDYKGLKKAPPAYFTYKGSLTTPGCHENVRWVVLKKPVKISGYLLYLFRNLKARGWYTLTNLCDNFRPIQKLKGRKVEVFEPKKEKKKKKKKKEKIEDRESVEVGDAGSGSGNAGDDGDRGSGKQDQD